MSFDGKFFTLLAFIIINLLIVSSVKTRTTIVTSLIIAHLVAVLFFSLSISSYNSFKEIVLALIVYSMVILFLISNYNPIYLAGDEIIKINNWKQKATVYSSGVVIFLIVFTAIFLVVKKMDKVSDVVNQKMTAKQEKIFAKPMLLPSHPVHIAVKKFYFGKKFDDQWIGDYKDSEISQRKKAQLKDKLSDNFLLKRSSDVILLIVAVTTSILLLGIKRNQSES